MVQVTRQRNPNVVNAGSPRPAAGEGHAKPGGDPPLGAIATVCGTVQGHLVYEADILSASAVSLTDGRRVAIATYKCDYDRLGDLVLYVRHELHAGGVIGKPERAIVCPIEDLRDDAMGVINRYIAVFEIKPLDDKTWTYDFLFECEERRPEESPEVAHKRAARALRRELKPTIMAFAHGQRKLRKSWKQITADVKANTKVAFKPGELCRIYYKYRKKRRKV